MGELIVYTRAWCPHCLKTLAFLVQNAIPFREVSLTHASELAARLVERFGDDCVPLLEVDGERVGSRGEVLERWARGEFDRLARSTAAPRKPSRSPRSLAVLRPLLDRLPGRRTPRRPPP